MVSAPPPSSPNLRPIQNLTSKSRAGVESRHMHKESRFHLFMVIMFNKIPMNSELVNTEPLILWETHG